MTVSFNANNNGTVQQPSRLNSAIKGAVVSSAACAVLIAGDKYFPNLTQKAAYLLNFSAPPKEIATKGVLGNLSLKTKIKGVAAIALLTGIIAALFPSKKQNS